MKERFRKEVGDDYKLFFLTGLNYTTYKPQEMINLGRFLSVIKIRDDSWRSGQSFVLVDRWDEKEEEGTVEMYGYVRGSSYR